MPTPPPPDRPLRMALTGNPNSGKTTLFNQLTGASHHVGNYPGVTVDIKTGPFNHEGRSIEVTDLPGIYGLSAFSAEERLAVDWLLTQQPDVVVDIVDASNPERSLYLAIQLIELGLPLVLVFNMADMAEARGLQYDLDLLSRLVGVPIVSTVGNRNQGVHALKRAAALVASQQRKANPDRVRYGQDIDARLTSIAAEIPDSLLRARPCPRRWIALKLLERDPGITEWVRAQPDTAALLAQAEAAGQALDRLFGDPVDNVIADRRYGFISGACQESIRYTAEARHQVSDRIDGVLTDPVWGLPLFLGIMLLTFKGVFLLSAPPMAAIEWIFKWISGPAMAAWPAAWPEWIRSLLADGIIGGVGGVLTFLPPILFLFMAIAILEDTGYMARAAFIMDRWMHRVGLHGKSFIPLLLGFGCSVPAILATRILESRRDRLITMFILPLVSCGARFALYALLIPAFFPLSLQAPMLWLIYLVGIGLAGGIAKLLGKTLFRGEATPLVMELPPYRMPTAKSVGIHVWERGRHYLHKAGTVILGMSILMWVLNTFPRTAPVPGQSAEASAQQQLSQSWAGQLGHGLEPVLRPMGFDWKIGTALIGALAAKEAFIAQMSIMYALSHAPGQNHALRDRLRADYTPLTGLCLLLFSLLSMPCASTLAVTRSESGSWRWALLQFAVLTLLAFAVTAAVYQVGSRL